MNPDPVTPASEAENAPQGKPYSVMREAMLYQLVMEAMSNGMGTRDARRWAARRLRKIESKGGRR